MRVGEVVDPWDAGFSLRSIPDVTQWYTRRLEELVRQAPGQYWWLHQRWREPAKIARLTAKRRRRAA
jgi:KDO2-lipid IV(A) lauroyltransferase